MRFLTHLAFAPLTFALVIAAAACSPKNGEANATNNVTEAARSPAGLQIIPLTIKSGSKIHKFSIELAQTGDEQAKGMMFRTEMAPDTGMLFPFAEDRMASFWMKNTVIPLDIIFVRRDGTIESIAANTVPYSLDPVRSGEPVGAVLELTGGRAEQLSIKLGDLIQWDR